jgi:hypothetical protein
VFNLKNFNIAFRASSFALTAIFLFIATATGVDAVYGQDEMSAKRKLELCKEKEDGIKRLELEKRDIRFEIGLARGLMTLAKNEYKKFLTLKPDELDDYLAKAMKKVEGIKKELSQMKKDDESYLQTVKALRYAQARMDFLTEMKLKSDFGEEVNLNKNDMQKEIALQEKELNDIEEKENAIARQISILRESMVSLKCSNSADASVNGNLLQQLAGLWRDDMGNVIEIKANGTAVYRELSAGMVSNAKAGSVTLSGIHVVGNNNLEAMLMTQAKQKDCPLLGAMPAKATIKVGQGGNTLFLNSKSMEYDLDTCNWTGHVYGELNITYTRMNITIASEPSNNRILKDGVISSQG